MPTENTRKLIRMGKESLLITVPRAWAKYNKLKAGDIVIVIADHCLTIRPLNGRNGDYKRSRDENEACKAITEVANDRFHQENEKAE